MKSNYTAFAKSKTLREIQGEEVPTKAISPPPPDQTGQTGVQTGCKTTICVLLSPGSSFPLCHFQLCPRPSLLIGEVCQAIPPEGLLDTLEDFETNLALLSLIHRPSRDGKTRKLCKNISANFLGPVIVLASFFC